MQCLHFAGEVLNTACQSGLLGVWQVGKKVHHWEPAMRYLCAQGFSEMSPKGSGHLQGSALIVDVYIF